MLGAIVLTTDEVHLACAHGVFRRMQKISGNRGDRVQKDRSTWDNELEGACAEMAFCKWRGIYWTGASDIRAKDGGQVEVRWTRHYNSGGLIVYQHDADDSVFVLSDGFAPAYRFVGYLRGADGKRMEWLTNFGYLAPRNELIGSTCH